MGIIRSIDTVWQLYTKDLAIINSFVCRMTVSLTTGFTQDFGSIDLKTTKTDRCSVGFPTRIICVNIYSNSFGCDASSIVARMVHQ